MLHIVVICTVAINSLILTSEALGSKTTVHDLSNSRYAGSFQVRLNEFFKRPVPDPLKGTFSIYREYPNGEELDLQDTITLLTAAPGAPGVPRPLWLVLSASLPTGLLWYGYYKFVVEEELLQMELDAGKQPRGFGGYGTLGLFTYGTLLGPLASLLHIPGGIYWSLPGIIFIYYSQFLLYDRVNKLYEEDSIDNLSVDGDGMEDCNVKLLLPLQVWWCLPIFFPLNFVVGLRQVHFLSQYLYRKRGATPRPPPDPVAEFLPFIKKPSLTWQELLVTPSLWCSLFSDAKSFDSSLFPGPIRELFGNATNYYESE